MGCKFDYIEKVFRESNPELADKLNSEHEAIVKKLLEKDNYEISEERKLIQKPTAKPVSIDVVKAEIEIVKGKLEAAKTSESSTEIQPLEDQLKRGEEVLKDLEKGPEVLPEGVTVNTANEVNINVFNNKSLLPQSNIGDMEVQSPEVMLPSKFKMDGKLVDLFEGFDGTEGKYLKKDAKGNLSLKEGMIDMQLLDQFMFRIPTSSHSLGAATKIVGFLPPESGDLAITSKDFIVQMGQDFDVDKLTAYQYNHLVGENGEITKITKDDFEAYSKGAINKETAEKIVDRIHKNISDRKKEIRTELKMKPEHVALFSDLEFYRAELRSYKASTEALGEKAIARLDVLGIGNDLKEEVDRLSTEVKAIFNMGYDALRETMTQETKDVLDSVVSEERYNTLKDEFDLKLIQNDIIEIHMSIYKNPDNTLQAKINKALSMDYATGQAEGIDALTSSSTDHFDILSPRYQMHKMNLGASGAAAIGIYAKGVTAHSLFQQSDFEHRLQYEKFNGEEFEIAPLNVTIGKIFSDGVFGKIETLSEDVNSVEGKLRRKISELQDEKTNTATDNEKAQILGRVGLNNNDAIAVDNLLGLLGIDSEINIISKADYLANEKNTFYKTAKVDGKDVYYTEHSLPYLLSSQPIIKEFFDKMAFSKSQITGEDFQARKDFIEGKLMELGGNLEITGGKVYSIDSENKATLFIGPDVLTAENMTSALVVSDPTIQIAALAQYLHLMSVSKKFKDYTQLVDMSTLGKSFFETNYITDQFIKMGNSNAMIISNPTGLLGEFSNTATGNTGEISLPKGTYFTPKTAQGAMVANALSLSQIFKNLMPYEEAYLDKTIKDVAKIMGVDPENKFATITAHETIMGEIKKYITSSEGLGIFTEDADVTRKELLYDTKSHESLSTYAGTLRSTRNKEYQRGLNFVKDNKLMTVLKFKKGLSESQPSLVLFNNAEASNISNKAFEASLAELLLKNLPLPPKNGEPYTTRKLAQELIAYSFVTGGIKQGAVQFHKFIPIEYYDSISKDGVKTTEILQQYDNRTKSWSTPDSKGEKRLKYFTNQFFQNNITLAKTIGKKGIKFKEKGAFFEFNPEEVFIPTVVKIKETVFNPMTLAEDAVFTLYSKISEGRYERLVHFDQSGIDQYTFGKNMEAAKTPIPTPVTDLSGNANSDPNVVLDLLGLKTGAGVGTVLSNIISHPDLSKRHEVRVELAKFLSKHTDKRQDSITIVDNSKMEAGGRHVMKSETSADLYMNSDVAKGKSIGTVADVFMHETMHAITVPVLNQYIKDGILADNAPKEVKAVYSTFLQYKSALKKKFPTDYEAFFKEYKAYSANKTNRAFPGDADYQAYDFSKVANARAFYAALDIKEFVAISLSNNKEFIAIANKLKYADKSLLEKIAESLSNLFKLITENLGVEVDSVAYEAIKSSLMLVDSIETQGYSQKGEVSTEEMISIFNEVNSFKMTNFEVQARNKLEKNLESKELKCN